jgi:hypothetical protein
MLSPGTPLTCNATGAAPTLKRTLLRSPRAILGARVIGRIERGSVLHQVDPALAGQRHLVDAGLPRRSEREHAAVLAPAASFFFLAGGSV